MSNDKYLFVSVKANFISLTIFLILFQPSDNVNLMMVKYNILKITYINKRSTHNAWYGIYLYCYKLI